MEIKFTKDYVVIRKSRPLGELMVLKRIHQDRFVRKEKLHSTGRPKDITYTLQMVMERITLNGWFYIEFDHIAEAIDYVETLQSLEKT